MKRLVNLVLVVCLLVTSLTFPVSAKTQELNIKVNGQSVNFPDAQPFIDENNRTLVPVRFIAEQIGAEVKWIPETHTVKMVKGMTQVVLNIGENQAKVNEDTITFDTKAILKDSRTFVPLRFISEAFDARVTWDAKTWTVNIRTIFEYTEDGRKIRDWDLPSNADEYEYILADIPNEAYELKRPTNLRKDLVLPKDLKNDNWMKRKDNLDKWVITATTNLDLRINVDSNTIGETWARKLAETYFYGVDGHLEETSSYAKWAKENKVNIQGIVKAEPSLTYAMYNGIWVRCYVKFKIDSFEKNDRVIFENYLDNQYVIKGEWYEGWIDVKLGTNNIASEGQDLRVTSNDSYLIMNMRTMPK